MAYRITVDTGGTFTDVVVCTADGRLAVGKAMTDSERSFVGMRNALDAAAAELGVDSATILRQAEILIFGTTRATNAIVTRTVAKTAFLTTSGFPDVLVLKEGGKFDPHDFSQPYPEPYVPRRATFEIDERVDAEGGIVTPLDEDAARRLLAEIGAQGYQAVAVCLVWCVANPVHEVRLGELIAEVLPDVPFTLSHQLIPIIREYRRASTTAIDASLKPLMKRYLEDLARDIRDAGFTGELFVSTSMGGCMRIETLAENPVHSVKSGPAMAPVAGRIYGAETGVNGDILVCDAGGTTFDVGLVRQGDLVLTRDTWLGRQWVGDLISMSTVDVRSVGAGGGSIAWVDSGGLLQVGPQSAGSSPGPACYGAGGTLPTVTDAALVLGYMDPELFVGGRMRLDQDAAMRVIAELAAALDMTPEAAAYGILLVTNELMIKAIHEITVMEGINPRESMIVAGGGAAGLNIFPIAKELGCEKVLLPETASVLSACGMQFADIVSEASESFVTTSRDFHRDRVNAILAGLRDKLDRFGAPLMGAGRTAEIRFSVEARYQFQVWDLEVALPADRFADDADLARLVETFHAVHERVFAVRDEQSVVEFLNWKARLTVGLEHPAVVRGDGRGGSVRPVGVRRSYFGNGATVEASIYRGDRLSSGSVVHGPAVIEVPTTTIVVYPGMAVRVSETGGFMMEDAAPAVGRRGAI